MSIEIHCPQCQKLIKAPDDAGGKRGKCPYCKNSVFIPRPPDEREEIPLAPIDESEEERLEQLRQESIRYTAALDHATESVPDVNGGASADESALPPPDALEESTDVAEDVEAFILAMRDSKLDLADAAVARLKRSGPKAREQVEAIASDQIPPTYKDVPDPVVKGLLKTLLNRLSS